MTKAIDLFAGLGGFSSGAQAAGVHVVWAANHWPSAVEWFGLNHPGTKVACQDLHLADFASAPDCDMLLASPACQGHARARGKERPHHDAARATAWAVISAAEAKRPAVVLVENVPEFRRWTLYATWTQALRALGYAVAEVVIDAADVGVPQHRERLFIIGTRTRSPLLIAPPKPETWTPASTVVDFAAGEWSPIERPGRAAATLRRIERGRASYGNRFLLAYYSSERGGRSLHKPLGTIRTRGAHALVDGDRMRMLLPTELRAAMGFPSTYLLPESTTLAIHLLGNAVAPPVATWLVEEVLRAA